MQSASRVQNLESITAGLLAFDVNGSIASITINRPESYNSFTIQMYRDLAALCEMINFDEKIRILMLKPSTERAFASGTDINEFRDFVDASDAIGYEKLIDQTLTQLESCRVPTIAVVSGICVGGGFAIAACCDIRIAQANLRIGLPMAKTLGNCLSMQSAARCVELMGIPRLKELLFTAKLIDADTAHSWGIVSEVYAEWEQLIDRASSLADSICSMAPLTMEITKIECLRLRGITTEGSEELITKAYSSEDFREGLTAFLGKRKPRWTGK